MQQSIEEIVADAVEKKRIQDAEHETKCKLRAQEFLNSLPPAITKCLIEQNNHMTWIWLHFQLPTGEKFQAEVDLYSGQKGAHWRPYVFDTIWERWEYGRRYGSYVEAIAQAVEAKNLQSFLAKKEIKI